MNHDKIVKYYSDPGNVWFIDDVIDEVYTETRLKHIFPVRSNYTPDLVYITEDNIYIGEVKQNNGINQMLKAIKQVHQYGKPLRNKGLRPYEFIILKEDIFMFNPKEMYQKLI